MGCFPLPISESGLQDSRLLSESAHPIQASFVSSLPTIPPFMDCGGGGLGAILRKFPCRFGGGWASQAVHLLVL